MVFVAIGLIFVGKETSRRQEMIISELNTNAEVAKAQAAQANEKAEAERLSRMKFESDMTPRAILWTNTTTDELMLFAGTRAIVEFDGSDREASGFAQQLGFFLQNMRWDVTLVRKGEERLKGIRIFRKITDDTTDAEKTKDAGMILACQLEDRGMHPSCTWGHIPSPQTFVTRSLPENVVMISVMQKETPYIDAVQAEEGYERIAVESGDEVADTFRNMGEETEQLIQLSGEYHRRERARIVARWRRINEDSQGGN